MQMLKGGALDYDKHGDSLAKMDDMTDSEIKRTDNKV